MLHCYSYSLPIHTHSWWCYVTYLYRPSHSNFWYFVILSRTALVTGHSSQLCYITVLRSMSVPIFKLVFLPTAAFPNEGSIVFSLSFLTWRCLYIPQFLGNYSSNFYERWFLKFLFPGTVSRASIIFFISAPFFIVKNCDLLREKVFTCRKCFFFQESSLKFGNNVDTILPPSLACYQRFCVGMWCMC